MMGQSMKFFVVRKRVVIAFRTSGYICIDTQVVLQFTCEG
jgi:hypothetical protein